MDLDVVLPNESRSMPVGALRDLAREAEDLGFATAWLPDHVLPPGPYGPEFGGVLEPLVTIGHLAAVTERLRFGTSVLVAPLRNPFVLAKQAATLQELSGGRLLLGLGAGWSREEFDAVGADHAHRGAVTEDVLALLRHLFSGGGAPYTGRRFLRAGGVRAAPCGAGAARGRRPERRGAAPGGAVRRRLAGHGDHAGAVHAARRAARRPRR